MNESDEEINKVIQDIDRMQEEEGLSTIDIIRCVDCNVQVDVNRTEAHEGHIFTVEES